MIKPANKVKIVKLSTLKAKLDKIFSEYIRKKNMDEHLIIRCYTCGKAMFYRDSTVGHFIKRGNLSARYSETTVKPQCIKCNFYLQGNDVIFYENLCNEYGKNIIDVLRNKKGINKIDRFSYEYLIKEYTEKLKALK